MAKVNHYETPRLWVLIALVGMGCLFASCMATPSARAQSLPWSVRAESDFRVGLLFGRQHIRLSDPAAALNLRLDPELFLVGGAIELSRQGSLSARLAGSLSVLERGHGVSETRFSNGSSQSQAGPLWDLSPSFKSWEAAGYYRFLTWAGYRYSFLAGYRQIVTNYAGQPRPDSSLSPSATFQTSHSFGIPFMGIATTFFGPWWKGRVQLVGSPFTSANGSVSHREPPSLLIRSYRNTLSGAAFSLEVDGSVNVRHDLLIGIFGAYHRLDLEGEASKDALPDFRSSTEADFGVIGLTFMYLL